MGSEEQLEEAERFKLRATPDFNPNRQKCCGSYKFDDNLRFISKTQYLERCVAIGDWKKRETIYSMLDLDYSLIETKFNNNEMRTAHYTWWSFIPLNLLDQFRRAVNFYFLIALIMSFVIENPPVKPETWCGGFLFILGVTMAKQGYEDYLRASRDAKENRKKVDVLREGEKVTVQSQEIEVGDIVILGNESIVPCDLVILTSSNKVHQVYVETSNLDGEANLKVKKSPDLTKGLKDVASFNGFIECENPSPSLQTFTAKLFKLDFENQSYKKCSLDMNNLLVGGTTVKKTDSVYGCCVYAGSETKLAMNSKITRHKFSTVEDSLNFFLFFFLGVMIMEMIVSSIFSMFLGKEYFVKGEDYKLERIEGTEKSYKTVLSDSYKSENDDNWYLYSDVISDPEEDIHEKSWSEGFLTLLHWFLIYNYVIPISLYCCVEIQRFAASWLFGWDLEMYEEERDIKAKCNNSDITEELGLITHVFSDKTGTLTENQMVLKKYFYNNEIYDVDNLSKEKWNTFIQNMVVCHNVQLGEDGNTYVAESPDEEALVQACKDNGFTLVDNSLSGDLKINHGKKVYHYERLNELSFDSFRKCMSVIARDTKDGQIYVYCKGAEVALLDYDDAGKIKNPRHAKLADAIQTFSSKGLRTLVYGYKKISKREHEDFVKRLKEAQTAMTNRPEKIRHAYSSMEKGFTIVAATGIEDKLQDRVYETIRALKKAGISIWLLTGDKKETALTIARAAGLIEVPFTLLDLGKKSPVELENKIDDCLQNPEKLEDKTGTSRTTLLIDGKAVGHLMKYDEWKLKLHALCILCTTVIASRLSPIQKSQIIRIIKEADPKNITLAIGDGGNDVSMIQEAHVGIGLVGYEGSGASRAADFSFGKFKFLQRAMFVHGHWNYQRLAYMIQYSFFKNVACFTCQFYYAIFSNFSATSVFDEFFLMLYNAVYALFPVLAYGALEKTFPAEVLLKNPQLYALNRGNSLLNCKQLFLWLFIALYESAAVFFPSYLAWSTVYKEGFDGWSFGLFLAGTILTVVSFKILIDSRYWTVIFLSAIIISLVLFICITMIISQVWTTSSIYLSYPRILRSPGLWALFLLCLAIAILPDVLLQYMYDSRAVAMLADMAARMSSSKSARQSMQPVTSYKEI